MDADSDTIVDASDNCRLAPNVDQSDTDGDGSGDICEPEPQNPSVGVPSAEIHLTLTHGQATGQTVVTWAAEPRSAEYRIFRGSHEEIRGHFYGACRSADDLDSTDTVFADSDTPAPGELATYLVIGVSMGGTPGLAGLDCDERQRDLRAKDCL